MNRIALVLAAGILAALVFRHGAPAPALSVATAPPPRAHLVPKHPASEVVVYVAGEVARPGLVRIPAGARAADALERAGGFLPGADAASINLAAILADGDEIVASKTGAHPIRARTRTTAPRRTRKKSLTGGAIATIDLNSADASALSRIPGVGERLAQRIVLYRQSNGPFSSLDELADVAGMTDRRIDDLAPFVTL